MTSPVFQCSTCGAPLLPKGNATVVRCSYCRASVVVPEELRQKTGAQPWSTLVFDGFTANDNNWLVGSQTGEHFTKLNRAIADGRYRWEAQVNLPFSIAPAWLMGYPVSDFHLSVNSKHIRGSRAGSGCGVIFRVRDNQNYYCFRILDTQFFAVSMIKDNQWRKVVDSQRTDTIKPHGVNHIEVIAQAAHFAFLINGQIVSEIDDEHFSEGLVGLSIEGYTPGEDVAFDFLDITLRAP
jgi:LSD1 subclass zinc finger protein